MQTGNLAEGAATSLNPWRPACTDRAESYCDIEINYTINHFTEDELTGQVNLFSLSTEFEK